MSIKWRDVQVYFDPYWTASIRDIHCKYIYIFIKVYLDFIRVSYSQLSYKRLIFFPPPGLNASLLVRHPETKKMFVNFDPQVLELIVEARYMVKLNLEIPESAVFLIKKEQEIKDYYVKWVTRISSYLKQKY